MTNSDNELITLTPNQQNPGQARGEDFIVHRAEGQQADLVQ